jgi:hypothetical protein
MHANHTKLRRHATLQAEVKRRTDSDRQLQAHFDSEIKSLQVRRVSV